MQRTQELEEGHKQAIETQAQGHATKLLEAIKIAEDAEAAKAKLESKVSKLEEELTGNREELLTLQASAQKAAHTLGDLQMQLSTKSQELSQATDTKEDLKLKL